MFLLSLFEGGIGFFSFDHFLDPFSVFALKNCCSFWFVGFPFTSIWFSVFSKYTSSFSDLVIDVAFGCEAGIDAKKYLRKLINCGINCSQF